MTIRPSMGDTLMAVARLMAERSTCSARAKVGVVLSTGASSPGGSGQIIATGYNGSPRGFPHCDDVGCLLDSSGHCLRSVHAEENAIIQCAKHGVSTVGCNVYVTHSPCIRCTVKLIQAEVDAIYYAEQYGSDQDFLLVQEALTASGITLRKMK